jgi:hypothetical protein
MNREDFEKVNDEIYSKIKEILTSKGTEYQSGENVFSNFETNAFDLGLSKYQIWSVYFSKHTKSILNAIKKNPSNPNQLELAEKFDGRIIDSIAYLLLLNAMIKSEKN